MLTGVNEIYRQLRQWRLPIFLAFTLLLLPTISRSVESSPFFEPYSEKHANGWIDWPMLLLQGIS